jgi:hypothetical protein
LSAQPRSKEFLGYGGGSLRRGYDGTATVHHSAMQGWTPDERRQGL